jgi:hypothetical protein
MVAAYIDPALGVLRTQLRLRYPGIVIYWIGDEDHQNSPSDHNPEADGSVDAIDLMIGTNFTRNQCDALVNILTERRDGRIQYLIWWGRIWKPSTGWRTYTGRNPHRDHLHVSRNDVNEASTARWNIDVLERTPAVFTLNDVQLPQIGEGDDDARLTGNNHITRIQRLCGFVGEDVDGIWGGLTTAAIERTADVPNGSRMTETIYRKLYGLA